MLKKDRIIRSNRDLLNAEMEVEENKLKVLAGEPTEKEIREGIWQYLVDHSAFTLNGKLKIFFIVKDKEDFWRRCNARILGQFKRHDVAKVDEMLRTGSYRNLPQRTDPANKTVVSVANMQAQEPRKVISSGEKMMAVARNKSEISNKIDRNGSVIDKILLWCYRKLRNRLFPRIINETKQEYHSKNNTQEFVLKPKD